MTQTKKKINPKGWVSLVGIAISHLALANTPTSPAVLIINGENISDTEYHRELELLPGPIGIIRSEFTRQPLGVMALEKMIQDRILLQLAKKQNVSPAQEQIQDLLKERLAANPKLLQELAKFGYTQKDFEKELKLELAEYNLITRGVKVTNEDITKYYNDNPKQFSTPVRYKFKIIMVRDDAGKATVDKELSEKKDFSEVATKHSVDSSKDNGGSVAPFPADMLPDHMKKVFENLKPGEVSEWAQGNGVNVKFLLEETLPESKQPLDTVLKKELERRLMIERGRAKNDLTRELKELGEKSKIEYKGKLFSSELMRYIGSLKEVPKTSPSTSTKTSKPEETKQQTNKK